MVELLFLPTTVHRNGYSIVNILSFVEVANIAGVHINMDTSKEIVIKVHMQDRCILHFRVCKEGLFYTNLDDYGMVTNPTNTYVNPYFFLSTVKQNSEFFTDSEVEEARKSQNCSNIYTGQEHLFKSYLQKGMMRN